MWQARQLGGYVCEYNQFTIEHHGTVVSLLNPLTAKSAYYTMYRVTIQALVINSQVACKQNSFNERLY